MYETRARKSNFVHKFTKTPEEIVCPHFYILAFANGCPYKCTYCYLRQTFRFNKKPVFFNNFEKLFADVQAFLKRKEPSVLNTGELTDSLAWGAIVGRLYRKLIPLFDGTHHFLLLLTKSDRIGFFRTIIPSNNTIISFSINSEYMASNYERGVPEPRKRLLAANKLLDMKWRVRLRIDPMIAHKDWQQEYSALVNKIDPRIERVTLGTLRYFPGLRGKLKKITHATRCETDGRYRLPMMYRLFLYGHMINKLKECGIREIGICKEEKKLWEEFSSLPKNICNCTI